MRFQNTAGTALDFQFHGKRVKVPLGGSVEIPDQMAFAIAMMGLPLAPPKGVTPRHGQEPLVDADEEETKPAPTPRAKATAPST